MTAIGYIRISTRDQSQYSLPYQEAQVRKYAEANKLDLLAVFQDNGESSYTFDRPDWTRLESFIKQNKQVKYLIIFDHDRFSRNLAEAMLKIGELQKKYGITVLATTENFDTDFTDPSTFMFRAFKYMMAEGELHRIRKRTKDGIYQALTMGRYVNKAPYGYLNAKDENNKKVIVIDEEKAYLIRLIFREFLNGTGIEEIRRIAKQQGYKQASHSAIQRVLTNAVYAGLIKVPGRKGIAAKTIKATHAPIVSEFDFWSAQEKLKTKNYSAQNNDEVPLRGVLHCWCGRKVTAGNSKSKSGKYYWYYLCNEHKKNMSAVKLHKQWNSILDTISLDADTATWLKEKLSKRLGEYLNSRGDEIKKANTALKLVANRIRSAEEKFLMQPDVSQATYSSIVSSLRSEQSELQARIAQLNTSQQAYWDRLQMLLPRLGDLRNAFDKMDLTKKHRFINIVFDNSLSHDGETYRTQYLHPLFADKELLLNEKRLLVKEQPVIKFGTIPVRSEDGNPIELLDQLAELFAA